MKQRAVLVENEQHSLDRLRRLLEDFAQDLEVVGEAVDGPSAVTAIKNLRPDIVFLDIDLPGFNGFQVLQELDEQPIVIFTTAYDRHALEAFRTYAIDYLLKPIEHAAIAGALTKLRKMVPDRDQITRKLEQLLVSVGSRDYPTRLSCREGNTTTLVKVGEILYFKADNGYTSVYTLSREFLIDTPLVDLERDLNPKDFIRIHRGTLVNISWIAEIRRSYERTTVTLKDARATELAVSRMYAENLRNI
jgi:two-component system LytT family response regulator